MDAMVVQMLVLVVLFRVELIARKGVEAIVLIIVEVIARQGVD